MTCATHHHACDCRERDFRRLLEAAKYLAQAHEKMIPLVSPIDDHEGAEAEFQNLRDIASWQVDEIKRLWGQLKWD